MPQSERQQQVGDVRRRIELAKSALLVGHVLPSWLKAFVPNALLRSVIYYTTAAGLA